MRKLKNEELGRMSPERFRQADKIPIVIILDNIRSLNNIGSIFRTADSFRVESLCLCGITGKPPHREIQKTALGATEAVAWKYFENTCDAVTLCKQDGYLIVAVEQVDKSIMLHDFTTSSHKLALVFGNEINGVSDDILDLLDLAIEIPQFGTKHSFNVTVSAGIVLWHLFLHTVHKK